MVVIINLEKQSEGQHFSNVESCALLKERETSVIGFRSNLEDEIRRNGWGLDVRMTTETHNVRVHCTGEKNQQQRKAARTANGWAGSNKVNMERWGGWILSGQDSQRVVETAGTAGSRTGAPFCSHLRLPPIAPPTQTPFCLLENSFPYFSPSSPHFVSSALLAPRFSEEGLHDCL